MRHPLQEMMEKRKEGIKIGIPSYCTANELVLETALLRAKELNEPVLIELRQIRSISLVDIQA